MKYLLILSFLFLSCSTKKDSAFEKPLIGKVIKIVDGDTYDILLDNKITKRIRMEGIDAPERGMPFYKVSKDYLGQLCFGQSVTLLQTNTDRYGRVVGKTYLQDGRELGLLMILAGYAWHFKKYSSSSEFSNAEVEARNVRKGLWVDSMPIAPWDWRLKSRNKN